MENFFTQLFMQYKIAILVILFIPSFTLFAQIPSTLTYQGVLRNASGVILQSDVNNQYNLLFKIYTTNVGGAAIWEENHLAVNITAGIFNVTLGETNPLTTINFDSQYWIGINVNGGQELLPRLKFNAVPYSLNTKTIPDNIVTTNKIADGSVDLGDLNFTPITNPFNGTLNINGGIDVTGNINLNDGSLTATKYITSDRTYLGLFSDKGASIDIDHDSNGEEGFEITSENGNNTYFAIWENSLGSRRVTINGGSFYGNYPVYIMGDTRIGGNLSVSGSISKGSGTFKIDHPVDPKNKFLYHSFVESPDMMNIYNGNIILDQNGESVVNLPDYFEALNMAFRYQLTCIGGYAPVYISSEISGNSFKISGGKPKLKVSWQVTGVRHDPYANNNRVQVEVEKPDNERGYYLYYKEYSQPVEQSINYLHELEINKKD